RRDGRAAFAWLLNNDTIVAPDSLAALVREAERDPQCGAVGGTMLHYYTPDVVQLASGATVSLVTGAVTRLHQGGIPRSELSSTANDYNFVCGGCLLVRREAVDAIGLFDERFFMYGEDADYCLRLTKGGWRIAYAADALVWHKGGGTAIAGSPVHD